MDADSSASAALHELMQQDVEAFCTESRALRVKLRQLQYTSVTWKVNDLSAQLVASYRRHKLT